MDLLPVVTNPVLLVVLVGLSFAAFVSERVAKIAGPVGAGARWWGDRQKRRVIREQELAKAVRGSKAEEVDARVKSLEEQVTYLIKEGKRKEHAHRVELSLLAAQAEEDARFRREHRRWDELVLDRLSQLGVTDLPAPPSL